MRETHEYATMTEAANDLLARGYAKTWRTAMNSIFRACNGNLVKSHGFFWKWVNKPAY